MTRPLFAALLTLPLLVSCGADAAGPPQAAPDRDAPPIGDYLAEGLPEPFDDGDVLRVTLRDSEISLQATCNTMFGQAVWDGGVLEVSDVGGTEMGCPGAGFEQDEWLVDFFTSSPHFTQSGTDLKLATRDAEIWLVPTDEVAPDPGPDAALEGTDWRLTGIEETDGDSIGMMGVPRRVGATLKIDGSSVTLEPGCNAGGGRVQVRGEQLRLRNVALTVMGCLDLRAEIEDEVSRVLLRRGWSDWSIAGQDLRVTRGDTTLLYRAR